MPTTHLTHRGLRVAQQPALTFLILVGCLVVPSFAQQQPYVQWPMGQSWRGTVVPGHDIEVLLAYGWDRAGDGKLHGGVDLIRSTTAGVDPDAGLRTIGAPVYAIADGRLYCENRTFSGYTNWPGRVIVIEHTIDGQKYYSQYGHLQYPKGGFPRDPSRGDPWAIPVFGTTGADNLSFRHPNDPYIYVRRGQRIGSVTEWPGDPSNSHLHFEIRTQPTGAWRGNCQGFGYTSKKSSGDPRSDEQWLEEVYHWLNPANFIYEHGRSSRSLLYRLSLLTDSHTPLEVRSRPSDEEGGPVERLGTETLVLALDLEKSDNSEWWYKVFGVDAPGWVKAFKLSDQPPSYERKREILVGEIPRSERTSTAIRYRYSFNELSGTANVPRGSNFTIWKAYGGCGLDAVDYALCQVGRDGRVRAYNHDCLSGQGGGTFGQWVRQGGCSRAREFDWEVVCCAEPF